MGKAKLTPTGIDLIKTIKDTEKKQAGRSRADYAGVTTVSKALGSGGQAATSSTLTQPYQKTGGRISGGLSLFPKTIDVVGGVISLIDSSAGNVTKNTSNINVIGEGNAADILVTINDNNDTGQIIFLKAAGYQITLQHGTATNGIFCPGSTNYILEANEGAILIYGSTGNYWTVLGPVGGAGGGADNLGNHIATQDLDMGTSDITNVTDIGSSLFAMEDLWVNRIRLQTGVAGTNFPTITANSPTGDMEINVPSTKSIFLEHNGTIRHTFTTGGQVTLGTGTFGGTLASGSHFSTAVASTTITSTTTTITSVNGVNMTVSGFSNDITQTVSGTNGRIDLNATGSASSINLSAIGATSSGIINLNATDKIELDATNIHVFGRLAYSSDPANTYIDLFSGSGDITITTKGGSDDIDILADGANSEIDIISAQSDVVVRGGGNVLIGGPVFTAFQSTTGGINLTLGSGSGTITVQDDLDIGTGARVDFGSTSGTAGALVGYLNVKVAGTARKIPYYAV